MAQRERPYPVPCPVCRVAMVGERSREDSVEIDIQRCLNCGTVLVETDRRPADDADDA